ncbi:MULTISPECIES: hypothetical protein [Streptomyces]|uniref:Uncharacterized protein n=1 Tax=Streptomyces luteosporeus TaxID=173856 RepID=A0ABN3TRN0_9ACTN
MFGQRGAGIVLSSIALLGATIGAPAAQAHDHGDGHGRGRGHDRVTIGCTGQENTTYTPGLTLTARTSAVRGEGAYTCSDAPGHTTSATASTAGVATDASCLSFGTVQGRQIITFADGRTSEIRYTAGNSERALGVHNVHLVGTVVKGAYQGAHAERDIQTAPGGLPTTCLEEGGLTHSIAFDQLTIES